MAKVNLEIIGKDSGASAAVKGVTGSLVKAGLVLEGLKIAWKAVSETVKGSIEAFKSQEQAEAKLKVQIGENISALTQFASEIQKTTTYGDEAVLMAQSLGLSMGITKDKINEATKGAIGLSEAFGIDLNTSMKMVTQAQEGNYNMLARYIPALRNATTEAEKNAIVQEAMAKGFDLAEAKADTFTGKLEQLKNIQGDNLEAFGKIVSIVGKDVADAMLKGATALNDFLTNADNIAKIVGVFEVVKNIFADLGKNVFGVLKDAVNDLKSSFSKLTSDLQGTFSAFDIIGGAVTILNTALGVAIKFIKTYIQLNIDWINVLKETGKALFAVFEALFNPSKWEDAKKQLGEVKDSFKNMTSNVIDNTKEMIDDVVSAFNDFPENAKKSSEYYAEIWRKTNQKVKDDFNKTSEEINQKASNTPDETKTKDNLKKYGESFSDWSNGMQEIQSNLFSILQEVSDGYFATQLENLQTYQEEHLAKVDEWAEAEMERQGVRQETKAEQLQSEIDNLREKLTTEQDLEQQRAIQSEITDKEKELKRTNILDEAEKRKQKIQENAKKKETELKRKQFEEQKAFSIANVWINAASSVMGWWSSFASMGIPGIVLAGVMTAATLAMAGVQTGLIASQQFRGEQGGVIGAGSMSGDNVMLNANKGEALIRNDDFNALVGMAKEGRGGGSTFNINTLNLYGVQNPVQLAEELRDLERYERAR